MRKMSFLVVALLMLAALPVAAQDMPEFITHSECEVDLTGETIEILHFGDLSGSYAFITQPLVKGFEDAINYFNGLGGVCGATLSQRFDDTGGDQAKTQALYDQFSAEDPKPDMVVLYASADAELLRNQVAEDEIPVIISAGSVDGLYGESGQEPGWIYATNPLYADQLGAFCQWLGASELIAEPVVGYISWPGAFGEAAFTAETIAYCAEQGVTVLETPEVFLPSDTDITGQVLNLTDEGANVLYTNTLASGPALVAATVEALGLGDAVQVAGVNWALDTSVGLLGARALNADGLPSTNGLIGLLPFKWWSEAADPAIAAITAAADAAQRGPADRNIAYLLGFASVDLYVEIYTRAANAAGGLADVDGAAIKAVMDELQYSPMGLLNVDFTEGRRSTTEVRVAALQYLNATRDGVATSGEDALTIQTPDGATLFLPILVPLSETIIAPDLRPGE